MNNQQRSISTERQLNKARRKIQKQQVKHLSLINTEPRKLASPTLPMSTPYGMRSIRPLAMPREATEEWEA